MVRIAFLMACCWCWIIDPQVVAAQSNPPGVVISQSPDPQNRFVGCPSIAILPNGDYVASHSWFGMGTPENETLVFRSTNRGRSWKQIAKIDGQWWSNLFVHNKKLYIMGVDKVYGRPVIRRSDDGGETWTTPTDGKNGLLSDQDGFHTAPVPVVECQDRLWRSYEDTKAGGGWPRFFRALVVSAPTDANLLDRKNWQVSENRLPSDPEKIGGEKAGWLEGNMVVTRDGGLVNIMRVNGRAGRAARIRYSDGRLYFHGDGDFIEFPGGQSKFTIRFDPQSGKYWSLANRQFAPKAYRNVLALTSSPDLWKWETQCNIIRHVDDKKHAFQYVDWLFDGDDIIAVSRTAWGNAKNAHDANYLTFHRIENFRALTLLDSAPWMGIGDAVTFENSDYEVKGYNITIETMDNDEQAFGNRKYTWFNLPEEIRGCRYTRTNGGAPTEIKIRAKRDCEVFVATAIDQSRIDMSGWTKIDDLNFNYTDHRNTTMHIFRRELQRREVVRLPQTNWTGCILLIPPDK